MSARSLLLSLRGFSPVFNSAFVCRVSVSLLGLSSHQCELSWGAVTVPLWVQHEWLFVRVIFLDSFSIVERTNILYQQLILQCNYFVESAFMNLKTGMYFR